MINQTLQKARIGILRDEIYLGTPNFTESGLLNFAKMRMVRVNMIIMEIVVLMMMTNTQIDEIY